MTAAFSLGWGTLLPGGEGGGGGGEGERSKVGAAYAV